MPVNVWHFSWRDSSDGDCAFAGLKNVFDYLQVFKFVVEWVPAVRNNAEIIFSPKYH